MGGNNSFSEDWGGVPEADRTHTDSGIRIDGHKVVFANGTPEQRKNILNSNSKDAVYLIATMEKDGTLKVHSINVFKGNDLAYEINLEFDNAGNLIPFDGKSKGSHAHRWQKDPETGKLGRKSHDRKNTFAISSKYSSLINKIVDFNKDNKHGEI